MRRYRQAGHQCDGGREQKLPLTHLNLKDRAETGIIPVHDITHRFSGFELADPDADQLARDVVTLGQRVQCLTGDELFSHLPSDRVTLLNRSIPDRSVDERDDTEHRSRFGDDRAAGPSARVIRRNSRCMVTGCRSLKASLSNSRQNGMAEWRFRLMADVYPSPTLTPIRGSSAHLLAETMEYQADAIRDREDIRRSHDGRVCTPTFLLCADGHIVCY
jgi:hypothetical protein